VLIAASVVWPSLIAPFAHGVPPKEIGDGLLDGAKQYKFMRAFYGIVVSAGIGIAVTMVTKPRSIDTLRGYVWGTISDAIRAYKGSEGSETYSDWTRASLVQGVMEGTHPEVGVGYARIRPGLAARLDASEGDLLYVTDCRSWLGGLYSTHVLVFEVSESLEAEVELGPVAYDAVVRPGRGGEPVAVRRFY
jgi:hypothetical protein